MIMKSRVLHISHTDIRSDSRILKEMDAVATIAGTQVTGIGAEDQDGAPPSNKHQAFEIRAIRPLSRRLKALPRPLYLALAFFELSLWLVLSGARLKPRLVHCHDTLVLPAGVVIKLLTGARLIYDAHELESDKNGQTHTLSRATWLMEKACWRWVDGFVSVSESIVAWYLERFPHRPSAVVLNSPVFQAAQNRETPGRSAHFRQTFKVSEDALIFVYVGILTRGRGVEAVLEVFSDPTVSAHLVFMGYGDLDGVISAASKRHANIHLHPPVPHQQVVEYTSGADVGLCFVENVSLSDYYCLPNKLFEYSFAGVPVLASNFPEIERVVDEFSLGKVCEPIPQAIRTAVLSFIDSPPARLTTVDLSPLSWSQQAQRLTSLYQSLLHQRGRIS